MLFSLYNVLSFLCFSSPCAVMCFARLCCAVLCCAMLCCAVLYCAVLCCAVLSCVVSCYAVMCCAVSCCVLLCCGIVTYKCFFSLYTVFSFLCFSSPCLLTINASCTLRWRSNDVGNQSAIGCFEVLWTQQRARTDCVLWPRTCAVMCCAGLCCAVLCCAMLCCAVLCRVCVETTD